MTSTKQEHEKHNTQWKVQSCKHITRKMKQNVCHFAKKHVPRLPFFSTAQSSLTTRKRKSISNSICVQASNTTKIKKTSLRARKSNTFSMPKTTIDSEATTIYSKGRRDMKFTISINAQMSTSGNHALPDERNDVGCNAAAQWRHASGKEEGALRWAWWGSGWNRLSGHVFGEVGPEEEFSEYYCG